MNFLTGCEATTVALVDGCPAGHISWPVGVSLMFGFRGGPQVRINAGLQSEGTPLFPSCLDSVLLGRLTMRKDSGTSNPRYDASVLLSVTGITDLGDSIWSQGEANCCKPAITRFENWPTLSRGQRDNGDVTTNNRDGSAVLGSVDLHERS
jgi:hypothetical protein